MKHDSTSFTHLQTFNFLVNFLDRVLADLLLNMCMRIFQRSVRRRSCIHIHIYAHIHTYTHTYIHTTLDQLHNLCVPLFGNILVHFPGFKVLVALQHEIPPHLHAQTRG